MPDAAREIAMWEGLANAELRGEVLRIMPKRERAWLDALTTVVRGFASTHRTPARRRRSRGNG
ncbi:MAG: hypothetical protein M3N32_05925 [Actinomycetota bacterium]|nr:hypothetical protein [Actinomycetota bacterium]